MLLIHYSLAEHQILITQPRISIKIGQILTKQANHGYDLYLNCEPEKVDCIENASEIYSGERLKYYTVILQTGMK